MNPTAITSRAFNGMPLLLLVVLLVGSLATEAHAQRTVVIEPGFGTINDAIMGDTTATGERVDSNTVYILQGGLTFDDRYYLNGRIRAGDYHLRVVAEEGSDVPPVLQIAADESGESTSRFFEVDGDLTLRGIYFIGVDNLGAERNHVAVMNGNETTLIADSLWVDYNRFIVFRFNGADGSIRLTNSHIRNIISTNNTGNAKIIDPRGNPIDSVYVENNTLEGVTSGVVRLSGATMNWFYFNHNTLYTVHGFVRDDVQENSNKVVDAVITNNHFINMGWPGDTLNTEDPPSHWEPAIFSFDSLSVVPGLEESDRDILISHNNFFWEQELVDYYNSGFTATCDLCTGGTIKQFPIFNDRAQLFVDAGLVRFEDAIEEDPEFVQTTDINDFIEWSKGYWTDPATVTPDMVYYDPDGLHEVTIWPLPSDLSYPTTKQSYTAGGGGFPLGDLNWFPDQKQAWINAGGGTGISTAGENAAELPRRLVLKGNYPNPFNPTTTVRFDLPAAADVHVEVYDLLGRRVLASSAQTMTAGVNRSIAVEAGSLPSGLYLYRVVAEAVDGIEVRTGSMMLIK